MARSRTASSRSSSRSSRSAAGPSGSRSGRSTRRSARWSRGTCSCSQRRRGRAPDVRVVARARARRALPPRRRTGLRDRPVPARPELRPPPRLDRRSFAAHALRDRALAGAGVGGCRARLGQRRRTCALRRSSSRASFTSRSGRAPALSRLCVVRFGRVPFAWTLAGDARHGRDRARASPHGHRRPGARRDALRSRTSSSYSAECGRLPRSLACDAERGLVYLGWLTPLLALAGLVWLARRRRRALAVLLGLAATRADPPRLRHEPAAL